MSVKVFERRLAALEEEAAKVQVSDEEREEFEKYRGDILGLLCETCRTRVEETERDAPQGACQSSRGFAIPQEQADFQYGVVRAAICPSCKHRLIDYLRERVDYE